MTYKCINGKVGWRKEEAERYRMEKKRISRIVLHHIFLLLFTVHLCLLVNWAQASDFDYYFDKAYESTNPGTQIQYYLKAIKAWTPEDGKDSKADAYYNLGLAYHNKGEYDRAIKWFTYTIKLYPENADAYYDRAVAYEAKGEHERADQDYDKAAALNPEYAEEEEEERETVSRPETVMKGKYTIGIVEIESDYYREADVARQATSEITSLFVNLGYFDIVSRSKLKRILEEQRLSLTGLIEPERAKKIGKLLGVDLLLFGNVARFVYISGLGEVFYVCQIFNFPPQFSQKLREI